MGWLLKGQRYRTPSEGSAAGELVMDEIWQPASVGVRHDEDRRTRADGTPPVLALARGKAFFPIQALAAIDAGRLPVPPN